MTGEVGILVVPPLLGLQSSPSSPLIPLIPISLFFRLNANR